MMEKMWENLREVYIENKILEQLQHDAQFKFTYRKIVPIRSTWNIHNIEFTL